MLSEAASALLDKAGSNAFSRYYYVYQALLRLAVVANS